MSGIGTQITEIVNELREERQRLNKSQQEVADGVGVSRGQVGHWETGKQEPNTDHLERWAGLFGWSIRLRLERQPGQAAEPEEDFAAIVGRLGIIWRSLPESARHGIADLTRGLAAMVSKER